MILGLIIGFVVGVVAGVLFGRRNKSLVEKAVTKYNQKTDGK